MSRGELIEEILATFRRAAAAGWRPPGAPDSGVVRGVVNGLRADGMGREESLRLILATLTDESLLIGLSFAREALASTTAED